MNTSVVPTFALIEDRPTVLMLALYVQVKQLQTYIVERNRNSWCRHWVLEASSGTGPLVNPVAYSSQRIQPDNS